MPLKSSEAFVIDVRKLKEADRLVILFTQEEGKVRCVAPSAARSVRRFGGRLERLSLVRATWYESEARDLARLDGCDLLEESFTLHGDLGSAAVLAYVAELVDTFAHERSGDQNYFRLVRSVLAALRSGAAATVLARYFEVWTLRLHGLMPELQSCAACGKDLAARGARVSSHGSEQALCPACSRGAGAGFAVHEGPRGYATAGSAASLSPSALALLESFRRRGPAEAAANAAPGPLAEIEAMAVMLLTEFVGHPFRSYRFLREVGA